MMANDLYKDNLILNLSLDFSVDIIAYSEQLVEEKKFVLARQILASGTSFGANSMEAQNAESNRHFVSKFKIALREADETAYWLTLCERAPTYPNPPITLRNQLDSIIKIINKIINKIISSKKSKMDK
jgi:four helix bundle protein